MPYTDKALEVIIIKLRREFVSGQISEVDFYKLKPLFEDMYTSLKAFLSSVQDDSYEPSDCASYLSQYFDTILKLDKLV
tara:strand:- start:151 stop:387 length:237 start_codon:yes stop_codon:yes gene_type:complete